MSGAPAYVARAVLAVVSLRLTRRGGDGAVRELIDAVLGQV